MKQIFLSVSMAAAAWFPDEVAARPYLIVEHAVKKAQIVFISPTGPQFRTACHLGLYRVLDSAPRLEHIKLQILLSHHDFTWAVECTCQESYQRFSRIAHLGN